MITNESQFCSSVLSDIVEPRIDLRSDNRLNETKDTAK